MSNTGSDLPGLGDGLFASTDSIVELSVDTPATEAERLWMTGPSGESESEDYSTEIMDLIGTSTNVEAVGFYLLGGYSYSMKGNVEVGVDTYVKETLGGSSTYDGSAHATYSGMYGTRKTGVLVNPVGLPDNTWRGFEVRPMFLTRYAGGGDLGSAYTVDSPSMVDDLTGLNIDASMRYVDEMGAAIRPTGFDEAGLASEPMPMGTFGSGLRDNRSDYSVTRGYSGIRALGQDPGERGYLDDLFDEMMQLTGTVGLTAFVANQYPGNDMGSSAFTGAERLSQAIVVGHLGFGGEPVFLRGAIDRATFRAGPEAGYDASEFAVNNPYYTCGSSPYVYNTDEMAHLKFKFGYDAATFHDHPYAGTRERMAEAIRDLSRDLIDNVIERIDSTKIINSMPLNEKKISRITGNEESSAYSPTGTRTGMGTNTSTDPGGGSYGY